MCLGISFGIWIIITFSQQSSETMMFNVQYIHHPEHYTLINHPPSRLYLNITASGYQLQRLRRKDDEVLSLNISRSALQNNDNQDYIILRPMDLESELFSQLDFEGDIQSITPDSILLIYDKNITKEVPVSLNIHYQLKPQFWLSQDIMTSPQTITVEGFASDVDSIASLQTQYRDFQWLSDTLQTTLSIERPTTIYPISLSTDSIQLCIPIEQYTEKSFKIPIFATASKAHYKLKTFPNYITVYCLVSLNNYHALSDSMFSAQVYYDETLNKDAVLLPVHIVNHSQTAKITKIAPEKVEFLLIKQ